MLKETITFTDYNGESRSEDHFFNLTEAEITKMQLGVDGGLSERLMKIKNENNIPAMMEFFEDLIRRSYGRKTSDGRFVKKAEYYDEFESSEAYSEFFMSLISDADVADRFTKGIIPAKLLARVNEQQAKVPPAN